MWEQRLWPASCAQTSAGVFHTVLAQAVCVPLSSASAQRAGRPSAIVGQARLNSPRRLLDICALAPCRTIELIVGRPAGIEDPGRVPHAPESLAQRHLNRQRKGVWIGSAAASDSAAQALLRAQGRLNRQRRGA